MSTGPEIWSLEGGRITHKGKAAIVDDAFADSKAGSLRATPKGTPSVSKVGTPAASGAEDQGSAPADPNAPPVIRKKKLTRNQMKARDERRKKRKLDWLIHGGPKPEDSDSD